MNRRSFFRNLVGSVAVLVSAYALPIHRFKGFSLREVAQMNRIIEEILIPEFKSQWAKKWSWMISKQSFPENMGDVNA